MACSADLDWARFNTNGIFPFTNLPNELQHKIIGHAMTATDREIKFPCLTNAGFTPNVNVGLLLANHCIYHQAHHQLRKQNTFIFGNYGSDLKTIASSVGPLKCRSGACGYGRLRSSLAKVSFNLGDEEMPGDAADRVYAFGCALRYLRPEIVIGSLYISLAYHTFHSNAQLSWFASALNKIEVEDKLTVAGDERFLKMDFEELPKNLGMDLMPVYSLSQAYNPLDETSPCWFLHRYVSSGKHTKAQDKGSVDSTLSEAGKTFAAQLSG